MTDNPAPSTNADTYPPITETVADDMNYIPSNNAFADYVSGGIAAMQKALRRKQAIKLSATTDTGKEHIRWMEWYCKSYESIIEQVINGKTLKQWEYPPFQVTRKPDHNAWLKELKPGDTVVRGASMHALDVITTVMRRTPTLIITADGRRYPVATGVERRAGHRLSVLRKATPERIAAIIRRTHEDEILTVAHSRATVSKLTDDALKRIHDIIADKTSYTQES